MATTRTHEKVRPPRSAPPAYDAALVADGIERAFALLRGRWKILILFHLFGGKLVRFAELERRMKGISQKMLAQQLRRLEADGLVRRVVHDTKPPMVEYGLTAWGQSLCPSLNSLLRWVDAVE